MESQNAILQGAFTETRSLVQSAFTTEADKAPKKTKKAKAEV